MDDVWERVQRSKDRETLRLKVPTGWIYLITEFGEFGGVLTQSTVFVPQSAQTKSKP